MKNIFGTSWKTTLAGIIAGLPVAINALINAYAAGQFTGQSGSQLAIGIGLVLLGALSKDKAVTGGTVGATPEAQKRVNGTATP